MGRTVVQILNFHPHSRRSMEVFLVALAEALRLRGWRTVHVIAGEPGDYFREELRRLDSPWLVSRFPITFRAAWALGRQLREYQPDVIQTTFLSKFSPSIWALKRVAGARSLVITDQTSGLSSRKSMLMRVLARARGALAGRLASHIIAVSEFVRKRNVESVYLPARKIRTVHNGAQPAEDLRSGAPRHEQLTIAFVGQLIPEKGVHTLLRAVKELGGEGLPPLRLLIAGRGWQRTDLERYCHENQLSHVEFLGQIDWVPRLFASADVVVIPSEWEEACAFSIIEAMGCGACLIASDAGGNPELVGRDGSAGLVFRKGDVEDLKAKMLELLRDRQRRDLTADAARARARREFSLEKMVAGYVQVFAELEQKHVARETSPTVRTAHHG